MKSCFFKRMFINNWNLYYTDGKLMQNECKMRVAGCWDSGFGF